MRIIAGRFRRRTLRTNPGLITRPLTDRVKETLFQLLEPNLVGARIADVFAGTGTIGMEALSRGAKSVVFLESDRRALDLLRENIAALKIGDETLCWSTDVLRTAYRPKNVPDFLPFDVVFFDPPYRMVEGLQAGSPLYRSLERLARPGVCSDNALLIFRTPEQVAFEMPAAWRPIDMLDMSSMRIHMYRLNSHVVEEASRSETGQADSPDA